MKLATEFGRRNFQLCYLVDRDVFCYNFLRSLSPFVSISLFSWLFQSIDGDWS